MTVGKALHDLCVIYRLIPGGHWKEKNRIHFGLTPLLVLLLLLLFILLDGSK